jgi:hypothetical protein
MTSKKKTSDQPGFAAIKPSKPQTSKEAPFKKRKVIYYSGLTAFNQEPALIAFGKDLHFRAYTQNSLTSEFDELLLDVSAQQVTRVYVSVTQLVLKTPTKTYRFEFNGNETTTMLAVNAAAPLVARELGIKIFGEPGKQLINLDLSQWVSDTLKNNSLNGWVSALAGMGYPVKLDPVDTFTKRFFHFYSKHFWKIYAGAGIAAIGMYLILGVIAHIDTRNKAAQATELRNNTHANPELTLYQYTDKDRRFSMMIPNSYTPLVPTTQNQNYIGIYSNNKTPANPSDHDSIVVTMLDHMDKAQALNKADFITYAQENAINAVHSNSGVTSKLVSQQTIVVSGHPVVKSVIRQTGTYNSVPVDSMITVADIYIGNSLSYQLYFESSTHNTHFLSNIDAMINSFTVLNE